MIRMNGTMKRLMRSLKGVRSPALALVLGLSVWFVSDALAQQVSWTLTIDDGVVTVNGDTVARDRLPESLNTMQNVQLTWSDTKAPIVAFGNRYYTLVERGLRELRPDEIERHGLPEVSISGGAVFRTEPTPANRQLVDQLNTLIDGIEQKDAAPENALREVAVQAAQTAAALPHLELQSYWYDLRESNQELYNDFLREQQLRFRAEDLALFIIEQPQDENRQKLEDELLRLLSESFDLKQKNREREIDQLESRLVELQRVLDERNAKRDLIIEKRFKELVGPRR